MARKGKIRIMKHLILIPLFLFVATPALAQERASDKIVILKTTSEQRALTEILSARIKSALQGEEYIPVTDCKGRACETAAE